MDISKLILPTKLKNNVGAPDTLDQVYILSLDEALNLDKSIKEYHSTDFVKFLNFDEDRPSWLRSAYNYSSCTGYYLYADGSDYTYVNVKSCYAIRPALRLNLNSAAPRAAIKKENENVLSVEFGEFPQKRVDNIDKDKLQKTSQTFFKNTKKKLSVYEDKDGKRYVLRGKKNLYEITPIKWLVRNKDTYNSDGYLDLISEKALFEMPFYPEERDENANLWQNSTIRGYLNGINVNYIKTNGDPSRSAPNGGDFSGCGFMREAFSNLEMKQTLTSEAATTTSSARKRKTGVVVDEKPMSVNEQIKFYVDNRMSFMLHGPSGIGKTARVQEIDPDLEPLVLRNGILPEEVIGKTIYPNAADTTSGVWVPPTWYVNFCKKCEAEPDKTHVLFIDELTNVREYEQSLAFFLVQYGSIGPNLGKLPENSVVVGAGNSKEESNAAYDMAQPLFAKFSGHLNLEPNIRDWLEWGSAPQSKAPERNKIHPLVASFVATYGDRVFLRPYDPDATEKMALDPRGWEQISNIIYNNKGVIRRELMDNKLGKEISAAFVEFAQNPPLMLEEVLGGEYSREDIPESFDAQYALALSLSRANDEQIAQVRDFIARELDAEVLAMFDYNWVGDNDERALQIADLETEQSSADLSQERE